MPAAGVFYDGKQLGRQHPLEGLFHFRDADPGVVLSEAASGLTLRGRPAG